MRQRPVGAGLFLTFFATLLLAAGAAAAAVDCGDPPMKGPAIPDGAHASRAEMLAGVNAVKAYSDAVDAYLKCKDQRALTVFQWMTEDQRRRWNEDLDAVHQRRVEVQRQMNEAIRIFNQSRAASDGTGGS
ncbi:MAG: hypothetical protein D6807_03010 [Alphaproteobacteria bacterium]|nr:MAG: hypothetical protein D6807_03010 [Alphaproteobacteria bacterium]